MPPAVDACARFCKIDALRIDADLVVLSACNSEVRDLRTTVALRGAKRVLRARAGTAAPFYWAPFMWSGFP